MGSYYRDKEVVGVFDAFSMRRFSVFASHISSFSQLVKDSAAQIPVFFHLHFFCGNRCVISMRKKILMLKSSFQSNFKIYNQNR
jgi:hypothetical protein